MAAAVSQPPGAMATSENERLAEEIGKLSDDLLDDLHRYLEDINTAGRVATIKKLHNFVDPQVRLTGTGSLLGHDIPVPLGPRDALKLIEAAQSALPDEGEENITDASVAQWEISPDRFSLGEHWQTYVDSISTMVCKELGVHGDGISAELNNMLLYEKRAMPTHHDAHKTNNIDEVDNNNEPVKMNGIEKNEEHIIENKDKRVKVYELKKGGWYDRGTGFCAGQLLTSGEGRISVRSEHNAQRMLLETEVLHDYGYQKQGETLIVWTESSGLDMAMSFEQADECAQIWSIIVDVQQRVVATSSEVHDGLSFVESTKIPGMFATLVISLPSAHWGGAVTVSHNRQKYLLQTHGHEYLAWYSDVLHEVQEVTSGYRWVLTYNLVQANSENFNSAASGERRLRAILTEWNSTIQQGAPEAERMIYQLKHKYSGASMSLSNLQGSDLLRAQRLLSVGDQLGYALYLAKLEKRVHGSAETNYRTRYNKYEEDSDDEPHAIEEILEESSQLTQVFDTDGKLLVTDIDIEEGEILGASSYQGRSPDEHDYDRLEGYSTHYFRDSVLVLVPNRYITEVLLDRDTEKDMETLSVLRHLAKRARNAPWSQRESFRKSLRGVCFILADNCVKTTYLGAGNYKYSDTTVSEAIAVCAEFGMTDMLPGLSSAFKDSLSANALKCVSSLKNTTNLKSSEERTMLETIFGRVVLKYKSVSTKYDTLSTLIGAEPLDVQNQEGFMPDLKPWVTRILATMFSDLNSLTSEDGDIMARIAISDTTGSLLQDRIIPNIERQMQGENPEKTTFMIAFLSEIFKLSKSISENLLSVYQPLVRMVATNLSFRKSIPPQPQPTIMYGMYGPTRVQPVARRSALNGKLLADTLGHIMDLQLQEHGQLLMDSVMVQASLMDPADYESTILPFLKGIIMRLLEGRDSFDMYRKLFQTCLPLYIQRFVGKEPVQINWSRNPVRCSCRDCTDLNVFLRSPVDRVKRIVVSKQRRHHLHTQLDAYTDCTHITERGYVETMVVTKQGKSFVDSLKVWTNRAKSALAALRSLEDEEDTAKSPSQLRKLLGDKYDEIMTLRTVRVMTAAQQQPTRTTESTRRPMHTVATSSSASNAAIVGVPNPPATRSELPQVAGQKRKAVVIDLSDN